MNIENRVKLIEDSIFLREICKRYSDQLYFRDRLIIRNISNRIESLLKEIENEEKELQHCRVSTRTIDLENSDTTNVVTLFK